MHNHFTRIACILLAIGLFIGCSSSSLFKRSQSPPKNPSGQELKKEIARLDKKIASDPAPADAYYQKSYLLNEWASKKSDISQRAPLYSEMKSSLDEAQNLYQQAENTSGLQKTDRLLKMSWSTEHNQGVKIIQQENAPDSSQLQQAAHYFHNATIILPDSSTSYVMEAQVLYKIHDYPQAIETLKNAKLHNKSKSADILEELGFLYLKAGENQKAVDTYESAKVSDQGNLNIIHGLVNAYIAADEHQKAVNTLDLLIKSRPNNFLYRQAKGQELYLLGEQELNTYLSSLKNGNQKKSYLEDAHNHLNQAEKAFGQARQINPTASNLQEMRAAFYQNTAGDYQHILPYTTSDNQLIIKKQITYYLSAAISPLKSLAEAHDGTQYWEDLFRIYSGLGMHEEARQAKAKMN